MPNATRPWQHVLDCIAGYLIYAERARADVPRALNFGPDAEHPVTVAELTRAMLEALGAEPEFDVDPNPGRDRDEEPRGRRLARAARRSAGAIGCRARRRSAGPPTGIVACGSAKTPRAVSLGQIDAYGAIEAAP